MQLSIGPEEAPLLQRILTQYLSELKLEISNTEKYEWRQSMKRDEELVKGLIARLESNHNP